MRRPSLNAKQRAYAREQRALLALRRAAVRLTAAVDREHVELSPAARSSSNERLLELEIMAMKYANTLNTREFRRLSK